MKRRNVIGIIVCVVLSATAILELTGCGGDSGPTPSNLAITTTSLPEQTVNHPYSASISGSGGAAPYAWSVSPALPGNLLFDTTTGAISGTPTTAATTTHTFTLRDSSIPSQTVEQMLSLTIEPPLAITTTDLPNASIAVAYNELVETIGGIKPLTFSLVLPGTGTLPPMLSLNPTTGMISGTPNALTGPYPFTVQVEDTSGQQVTQALSVRVTPTITTTTLPPGTVNQAYNQPMTATGGIAPLTWSISAGTLPAGLNLNAITGVISGTPTTKGTSSFTVQALDAAGNPGTQDLSIVIN